MKGSLSTTAWALLAMLTLAGTFGFVYGLHERRAVPVLFTPGPTNYDKLAKFYAGMDVDLDVVAQATAHAEDAAAILCMDDMVQSYLSMIHRESGFDPATDDKDSRHVAQVRRRYEKRLTKAWKALGVDFKGDGIKASVYMGMMMFRDKLREAHGDVFGGIRRYNGKGPKAELYAYRVLASRQRIFGQVHYPDEHALMLDECP